MAFQHTFSIVKPDVVERAKIGAVLSHLEAAGLRVVAARMVRLSRDQAEGFYAEHKGRPFFDDLIGFMTSGPVVVQVLAGEDAIARNRQVMGATNPADADSGTIRKALGTDVMRNAAHGSDSEAAAKREIEFFFGTDVSF